MNDIEMERSILEIHLADCRRPRKDMSQLDFLNFKEFQADVSLVVNEEGSGGWEVSISQGQSKVTITHQQLDRINKKIQGYIAEGLDAKQ